jgi:hypothetical protein
VTDPIIAAAQFLTNQLEWLRHAVDGTEPYAMRALDEITESARQIRHLVDGPVAQRFMGPCGAYVVAEAAEGCPVNCTCHNGPQYACDEPGGCGSAGCGRARTTSEVCDGDVYARQGASKGRCRECGAEVDAGERLIWLDDVRRDWLFTAKDIADAYQLNVKTIRSWHNRGQLAAHGHDPDGAALHKIGEVLDLAAGDAARREGDRATRARRSAARAAESEAAA